MKLLAKVKKTHNLDKRGEKKNNRASVYTGSSQVGSILPLGEHLAMFEGMFGCHNWGECGRENAIGI